MSESQLRTAFREACEDLGAISALLGFKEYPGVDELLRAITDLITARAAAAPVVHRAAEQPNAVHFVAKYGDGTIEYSMSPDGFDPDLAEMRGGVEVIGLVETTTPPHASDAFVEDELYGMEVALGTIRREHPEKRRVIAGLESVAKRARNALRDSEGMPKALAAPLPRASAAAAPTAQTFGMDRSQFHDKAWALWQERAFDSAVLPKLSIHAMRTLWNVLYDSMPNALTAERATCMCGGLGPCEQLGDASCRVARATAPQATVKCRTCNDQGMIGGPSYREPDEGGVPCPDCAAVPKASPTLTDEACEAIRGYFGSDVSDEALRNLATTHGDKQS